MIGTSGISISALDRPPAGWDDYVTSDPNGTFCHLAAWGAVLGKALRLEPIFLFAAERDALVGAMPLVRMPTLPWGTALVSMPYLNYGGPLGSDEVRRALVGAAVSEAEAGGDRGLEVRSRRATTGTGLSPGRSKVAVVLELPDDADDLFANRFPSKLRSQIRRPLKEGMEVRFGSDEIDPFYRVFAQNMRDLGTPVLPKELFFGLRQAFPEGIEFGTVYHQGAPVAAGAGFLWSGELEITWASSLRSFNRLSPNMLLYWSFITRAIERGARRFNFGRCTPGTSTHRFKRQWGGEDEALAWTQWPEATGPPDREGGVFRMATRVWQRLPLNVANRMGPIVARRLPTF